MKGANPPRYFVTQHTRPVPTGRACRTVAAFVPDLLRRIWFRPFRSAVTRLLLATSPPLPSTTSVPSDPGSAVPTLDSGYCTCLAVCSNRLLRPMVLPLSGFGGKRFQKLSPTTSNLQRIPKSTASHARHSVLKGLPLNVSAVIDPRFL